MSLFKVEAKLTFCIVSFIDLVEQKVRQKQGYTILTSTLSASKRTDHAGPYASKTTNLDR